MNKNKFIKTFVFIFFSFYFLFNIFILQHYGTSWDEPVHYQRAQVYLQYFLTRDGNNFSSEYSRQSIYKTFKVGKDWMDFSYWIKNDDGHPPLNGILAAIFNSIFYQNLGLLGDIESYHLFIVLVSVFTVALIFFWTQKFYGVFAGIIAFLSMALYPLFFGESHFNIKDPVEASFYSAALLLFYSGVTRNNWKYIIISSIFTGLSLGTKFNILFIVFTVFPWLIIYKWQYLRKIRHTEFISVFSKILKHFDFAQCRQVQDDREQISRKLIIACLILPFIAVGILYATWPFLWQNPLGNLLKIFSYYKEIGSTITYQPEGYLLFGKINTFAMQWILYTTPLIVLFFSLIGIFYSLTKGFKEKNKISLFILLWFIVPVIRVTMPNAGIYGGVRQIMEYIPAMAILSGIGAKYIVELLNYEIVKRFKHQNIVTIKPLFLLQLIAVFLFLPITIKLISIHPNENVYFNPLIGGLKGAKEKNIPYWGNTFGNTYKQGVDWINKNAEKNTNVARGVAYEDSIPRIWFRKDIKYSNDYQSGIQKKGEYVIELTHDMPVWSYYYYYNYAKNMLNPVYEVKIDEVPILTIWKNDLVHTKNEYRKKEETIIVNNVKKGNNFILADLEKEVLLTELNILFTDFDCYFTNDGYFMTADKSEKWINHPGGLGEIAFYNKFNPLSKKGALSYLFSGEKTQYIRINFSKDNNCLKDIKEFKIKKIGDKSF